MNLSNYKIVYRDGCNIAIHEFLSKYLDKKVYVRYDDLKRAEELGHSLVKYCKSNGEYHKEKIGEFRMVHVDNLK